MNTKIKHSKIKNTGILFELLTRQITVDIMNDKNGKAVSILKNYFSPKTELGKEYGLYKILTTEKDFIRIDHPNKNKFKFIGKNIAHYS